MRTDLKITDQQIAQNGVVSAPDVLNGAPQDNKEVFDRLVKNVVAPSVNGLVDEVDTRASKAGNEPDDPVRLEGTQVIKIGYNAGYSNQSGALIAIGNTAGSNITTGNGSIIIGPAAARGLTTGGYCVCLGNEAGRYAVNGTDANFSSMICIGNNTRVSGDNQMQLGPSTVTVYAQSAIQLRSDARDKTDIQPPVYDQLDFILGLRPVQYRMNPRERYDGNLDNDGSQAGKRLHNGFIAQEVKALADEIGFDFTGFQDHSINGGCDVMSLAYEQFIPALVGAFQKYVTETNARLDALEAKA